MQRVSADVIIFGENQVDTDVDLKYIKYILYILD